LHIGRTALLLSDRTTKSKRGGANALSLFRKKTAEESYLARGKSFDDKTRRHSLLELFASRQFFAFNDYENSRNQRETNETSHSSNADIQNKGATLGNFVLTFTRDELCSYLDMDYRTVGDFARMDCSSGDNAMAKHSWMDIAKDDGTLPRDDASAVIVPA
jgi:hypothetical protein